MGFQRNASTVGILNVRGGRGEYLAECQSEFRFVPGIVFVRILIEIPAEKLELIRRVVRINCFLQVSSRCPKLASRRMKDGFFCSLEAFFLVTRQDTVSESDTRFRPSTEASAVRAESLDLSGEACGRRTSAVSLSSLCAIDSFLAPQNIVFSEWAPIRDREHSGSFLIFGDQGDLGRLRTVLEYG